MVAIHVALTSGPAAQVSSGMYAFGDAVLFVAVFGVLALVPTVAALPFLRPYPRFWTALAACGLAAAIAGVAGAILFTAGRHAPPSSRVTWADLSLLRILAAPALALTFLVCAVFSPHRSPRFALLAASSIELAVSAYGGFAWLVPLLLR